MSVASVPPIAYFVYWHLDDKPQVRITADELAFVNDIVARTPGLGRGLVFTRTATKTAHPFADDHAAPALALQLNFERLEALEAALARDGHLQALARDTALPSLKGASVDQQAMLTRVFPVDDPAFVSGDGELPASYLVHYPGEAEDLNLWLWHYVANHPQIMRRFPGIRQIEIFSRMDFISFLPWPRANHMQRNKLVWDSPAALSAALFSPIIKEMRADFVTFPPFQGGNVHYPMTTHTVAANG
jgi:hypothetical protein